LLNENLYHSHSLLYHIFLYTWLRTA